MASKRNPALGFIFITVLIDVIGWGIIIPVIPKLLSQLTGKAVNDVSTYGGWLVSAYALMQFVCSPIIGGLSDRFGRRPVLLFALFGFGVDYIFQALAPTLGWLFIGRIIAGITGASFTTAAAYIGDISEPEKKAQNFGLIGAAFGLGFIIGPIIGGFCAKLGLRVPFIVAACFTFLNFIYGYFVLPESLPKKNRRNFDWKRANPVGSLMHLVKYPLVLKMSLAYLLLYLAASAVQSNWSYYTIFKFQWDSDMVGISLGVVGVMVALVQGLLIRVIIPKFGQKRSVYAGLLFYAVGLTLFAFASHGWMMFAFTVVYCLGGISTPAIQGILSTQIPPNQQGELQGALTSIASLTLIAGPPMMNGLFDYFTHNKAPLFFPGAPYLTGAVLVLFCLVVSLIALRNYKQPPPAAPVIK